MFGVCAFALLCLIPVSHSAPLACRDLVQPLDQLDPLALEGSWALVASSLRIIESARPLKLSDSIGIDFYNSTYTLTHRFGPFCHYSSQNISLDGPNYNVRIGQTLHFSGTFFSTSCSDCVVLSFNVDSPDFKSNELCLFSKRREVDQKEMSEFIAQVECLKMPKHVVKDPTKPLCPVPPTTVGY